MPHVNFGEGRSHVWGDRVAPVYGGCYILHLNREFVDAVHLQGVTVYGAIACIGHDLAWGDRMYLPISSGPGHGGCYILHLNRESVDAVPLQSVTVYGQIACIGHDLAWGDRMYWA